MKNKDNSFIFEGEKESKPRKTIKGLDDQDCSTSRPLSRSMKSDPGTSSNQFFYLK